MPKRAYALIGALVAFMVVVGSVLAWASFSGNAGSQRGLVIHSAMGTDVLVTFDSGQSGIIGPSQRERAFVVKRDEFPQVLRASTPDGEPLFEKHFEYDDLAAADFRISFDDRGFYPTTDLPGADRHARSLKESTMPPLLLNDVTVIDGTGAEPRAHASVLVQHGRIDGIAAAGSIAAPDGARVVDAAGRTLMPGLTDAHVHFGITSETQDAAPESHVSYVMKVAENIRLALDEGFTTVRDAGNLDPAFALAVEQGQIVGPRILPSGSFISQTGGHGDQRPRFTDEAPASIAGLIAHAELCDGVDAVRAAARKQIRRGATQVKLMASGGIMSPNDPLESLQFTVEEMAAAVHEARAFGRYAMAHCWTPGAMNNALDAGVRSLEHGALIDEPTARRMATDGAFLVPTIVILEVLARAGEIPEFSRAKLELVRGAAAGSVSIAANAGVKIGSGSDLLGPRQRRRASEIAEKAQLLGPMAAIVSATKTNAELFCLEERIGTIEVGKDADLVLVDGDPLADIGVLVDARNIVLVVKGGDVVKDALG